MVASTPQFSPKTKTGADKIHARPRIRKRVYKKYVVS